MKRIMLGLLLSVLILAGCNVEYDGNMDIYRNCNTNKLDCVHYHDCYDACMKVEGINPSPICNRFLDEYNTFCNGAEVI